MNKLVTCVLVLAAPAAARAGGLFAGDNGAQAAQRAGAFVAKADDPSALYHNPAGLAKAKRYQFFLGGNMVSFKQEFQRQGNYPANDIDSPSPHAWATEPFAPSQTDEFKLIPSLFASQQWNKLTFGEGIFAPHGMPNRHFEDEHTDVAGATAADPAPGPERYDVATQEGLVLFPSVGAAYRITDQIDVGARFSWGFGNIKGVSSTWALGNASEDPGNDGVFIFDVDDNSLLQWSLGVLARPTPWLELGAMYASKVEVRAKGTSHAILGQRAAMPIPGTTTFVAPLDANERNNMCKPDEMGTAANLSTCISFDLPMRANVGARVIQRDAAGREQGDLELDLRWEQWSAASDVFVTVDGKNAAPVEIPLKKVTILHGFRDTFSFLLGGSWRFAMGDNGVVARAGAGYETGAAPEQWTRLDYDTLDRFVLGLGAGYELAHFRIDAGFNYLYGFPRDVTARELPATCTDHDCHPQASPVQPLETEPDQEYHPITAGHYETHYLIGTIGVTAWF
jgi:long-subunit fatty acid transport protein